MTDSVAVFSPGTRITDNATGAVVSGALLEFYDADTTNPKTVYADKELATPLGTSVTCDSLGYPTSDGTTKTQIYVGTPAYKIVAKTSAGVVIWAHDNISGAVKVIDPGDLSVIATTPVVTKSLNYIIVPEDQSTEFVGNCSSGDVTFTLPSAVDVGDGWFVSVQHAGSANQVLINSTSSQTISSGSANYATVLPLSLSGESVKITSDGGNWRISSHTSPHVKSAHGIITVVDRLTAPPGSEVNGAFYLISGPPSGSWAAFAENDVVQYTSSAWVRFVPHEGWQVWVADEGLHYTYAGGAWTSRIATADRPGIVEKAVQTEVETEAPEKYPDASLIRHHPGVAKAWVQGSGGTIQADYGVSSLTNNSNGDYTIAFDTAFSSANYAHPTSSSANDSHGGYALWQFAGVAPTTLACRFRSGVGDDEVIGNAARYTVAFFGDQ